MTPGACGSCNCACPCACGCPSCGCEPRPASRASSAPTDEFVTESKRCHFRPSKPPWPSQMCATCGEWLDDHELSKEAS